MRLRIPLVPVDVRLERRPFEIPRLRFTLRRLMAVVALLAVVSGGYVTLVEIPARRRAYRAVGVRIDLLRRAATYEHRRERAELERAARSRERAGAEERAGNPALATLWTGVVAEAEAGARRAASRANERDGDASTLEAHRREAAGGFDALRPLGRAAEAWLASSAIDHDFPEELAGAKVVAALENEATTGGRSAFPTVVGPRTSVFEATAIREAEQFLKTSRPAIGSKLMGYAVTARPLLPDSPFQWRVRFTDPRTGRNDEVQTSISPASVRRYLAANP